MMPRIVEAKHTGGHRVWLKFHDGVQGEIDLSDILHGEIFKPLKDARAFARFRIDPLWATLVWDNGADYSPEALYERVKRTKLEAAE